METEYSLRYSDIVEEPEQMLQPIHGYENMPLLSLEDVVEPLISLVGEVKRMVWTVKQKCEKSINNLSLDEAASIMLYSMEVEPREKSLYVILNQTLRDKDRRKLEPWFLYLRLFITSLSKLPLVGDQTVYRGAAIDLSHQYPKGKIFVWWEFLWCTQSIEVLNRFLGKTGTKTLFKIECHNGKDICDLSCFQADDDILLPAARQFHVISNSSTISGCCMIHLKEIEPSRPFLQSTSPETIQNEKSFANMTSSVTSSTYQNENLEQLIAVQPRSWIKLNNRQLSEQDIEIIAKHAIIDKQCTVLEIGSNNISPQGISTIANALHQSTKIEKLYLSNNLASDSGAQSLALAVKNSTLRVLGLSSNGITDKGAQYLAEMLKENRRLIVLGLEENEMGDQAVRHLAVALKHNTSLQRLLLADNRMITDDSVSALVEILSNNHSMKRLNLRSCSLSESAKAKLRKAARSKNDFELLI